jgi:hypothetical protein
VAQYLKLAAAASLLASSAALAVETVTYTYDVHGRLVKVERSGGPSNGATTVHGYDKADNRLTKQTTGAPPNG